MNWINYHHLLYFWTVAREGSFVKASKSLQLTQPTVSAQIRVFEDYIGHKLFLKKGRGIILSETGHLIFNYAEEIFSLGKELQNTIEGNLEPTGLKFKIGIADVLPKHIAYKLINPAFNNLNIKLECYEGKPTELLSQLSMHKLDLVLSDNPISPDISIKAYNHKLGECKVVVVGTEKVAKKYKKNFPESLNQAPLLLPTSNTILRKSLDNWFEKNNIIPKIVSEFEDRALLRVFAQNDYGLAIIPSIILGDMNKFGLKKVAELKDITENYYAISLERKVKHPAVIQITENAKSQLFGSTSH